MAVKAAQMGKPWITVDPQSEMVHYLVMRKEFRDILEEKWLHYTREHGDEMTVTAEQRAKGSIIPPPRSVFATDGASSSFLGGMFAADNDKAQASPQLVAQAAEELAAEAAKELAIDGKNTATKPATKPETKPEKKPVEKPVKTPTPEEKLTPEETQTPEETPTPEEKPEEKKPEEKPPPEEKSEEEPEEQPKPETKPKTKPETKPETKPACRANLEAATRRTQRPPP